MRPWIARTLALTLALLTPCAVSAGSPSQELQAFFAAATRILDGIETDERPEERLAAIRAITSEMFNVHEAARLSLGPDWEARNEADREEFVRLFADLLERSFIAGVASRIRLGDGVNVTYLDESVDGPVATVRTTITGRSGRELPFDFRMVARDGHWAVRDVAIDGMSLTANYRAQFGRVIQGSSYPELVQLMRAKVTETPTELARPETTETLTAASPTEARPPSATAASATSTPADLVARAVLAEGDTPAVLAIARIEPTTLAVRRIDDVPATPEPTKDVGTHDPRATPDDRVTSIPINGKTPLAVNGAAVPVNGTAHDERAPASISRRRGSSASVAKSYWVQLGAFKNHDTARRLATLLGGPATGDADGSAMTVQLGLTEASLMRVRVGPFADRTRATATLREFQSRGYTPFIAEE
jgi:phospholipid transport system substrate-binding protein